jgi:hypothetical protein
LLEPGVRGGGVAHVEALAAQTDRAVLDLVAEPYDRVPVCA